VMVGIWYLKFGSGVAMRFTTNQGVVNLKGGVSQCQPIGLRRIWWIADAPGGQLSPMNGRLGAVSMKSIELSKSQVTIQLSQMIQQRKLQKMSTGSTARTRHGDHFPALSCEKTRL
jgi:hypothetical protein